MVTEVIKEVVAIKKIFSMKILQMKANNKFRISNGEEAISIPTEATEALEVVIEAITKAKMTRMVSLETEEAEVVSKIEKIVILKWLEKKGLIVDEETLLNISIKVVANTTANSVRTIVQVTAAEALEELSVGLVTKFNLINQDYLERGRIGEKSALGKSFKRVNSEILIILLVINLVT